ncbi:unnamed protein product [Sympodiomycopsis kandeliae]
MHSARSLTGSLRGLRACSTSSCCPRSCMSASASTRNRAATGRDGSCSRALSSSVIFYDQHPSSSQSADYPGNPSSSSSSSSSASSSSASGPSSNFIGRNEPSQVTGNSSDSENPGTRGGLFASSGSSDSRSLPGSCTTDDIGSMFDAQQDTPRDLFSPSDNLDANAREPIDLDGSPSNLQFGESGSSSSSRFDSLFDSADAFPKAEPRKMPSPEGFHMGGLSKRNVPLEALGRGPFSGRRGPGESSRLSTQERQQWMKVLSDVGDLFADKKVSRFASRNELGSKSSSRKRSLGGSNANRLAALQEGLSAEISPERLEMGVDEAKREMNSKVHEADLWDWAIKNVWGFNETALRISAQDLVDGKKARPTSTWATEAQFGSSTPFYAPVLHRLFVHFRDRLKAPHSALSVLRITRALGPQSFVLGCTPEIYSEALRTTYFWQNDLRGCLLFLQEARDLGVLSDSLSNDSNREEAKSEQTTFSTTSLPGVIQTITNDMSNRILGVRAEKQAALKQSKQEAKWLREEEADEGKQPDYLSFSKSLFHSDQYEDSSSSSLDAMDEDKSANHQINLESLSLPALDSLRAIEEMNTILNDAIKAIRPQNPSRGRRPFAFSGADEDADDFGFDGPEFNSRGDGRRDQSRRHSNNRHNGRNNSSYPQSRSPKLGPKAYLRPVGEYGAGPSTDRY